MFNRIWNMSFLLARKTHKADSKPFPKIDRP